ncbi:type I pantothenate kinase [Microbacterium sp. C7(2022)]|uniref:type I pantothenate kinase n=1 Tax=Microbacterium sp. C7(2022) TaxID=2992759 RepID=UPI00237A68D2|nr:type I pantothenate kinase [Microbacterium sp. C7(2022)]MDE0545828.1 type I pantothenate kinase [Microbacterium sp. C7(2022)]
MLDAIDQRSRYRVFRRPDWALRAPDAHMPLRPDEIERLRGLGDRLDVEEVADIYLPVSRLLSLHAASLQNLGSATDAFLNRAERITPFVIGIGGSVAVGKSTVARVLQELIRRWPDTPRVALVSTDGFLWPNAELERRGLMNRKGFPESYDRRSLLDFVSAIKRGVPRVPAPVYSHLTYDRVTGERIWVEQPDVVIVEGLNVLQPPPGPHDVAVSDLFDFAVYVHAEPDDLERWYVSRWLTLRDTAFANPASHFHRYTTLTDAQADERARELWHGINLPNLRENILPTRHRADLVLAKRGDHTVDTVELRKL